MNAPLILVAGLLSDERVFAHQAAYLPGAQIVCPKRNTPEKMVDEILADAPPAFALAGHSMGGWLCLEVMRRAPERVLKLCLLNTTARDDSEDKRQKRLTMIERAKSGHFPKLVEEIARHFVLNQELLPSIQSMFLEVGDKVFIAQEESMLARKPCLPLLPKIACPTLVIHAVEDRNFSLEEHQELASKIPDAKLEIVKDSGHMSPVEKPQEVTALMRSWLQDCGRRNLESRK